MKKYILNIICLTLSHISFAQGIFIGNGGVVHADGNAMITIADGSFTNNGTFNSNNSTLTFTGTASSANSSISGSTPTVFNNIVVNKTGNNVQVNQNISVKGNLSFTEGGIELKAGDIDFGTTGSLQNETEFNKAFGTGGKLLATATLNAPNAVNPANLGATLTSTQNLGSTTIKRAHNVFASKNTSIQRNYEINPTNNVNLNATLRLRYFDNELNGNAENTMMLFKSTDGGANFSAKSVTSRDATTNFLEATGVNDFSIWTAAPAAPLSVSLLYFTGLVQENRHFLTWATANEQNNVGFDIEGSDNGNRFSKIGFVKGVGNSNIKIEYDFSNNTPLSGNTYYRLKQLDADGKFSYSNVIALGNEGKNGLTIYPNPAKNTLNILNSEKKTTTFSIVNNLGQILKTGTMDTFIALDIEPLAQGVYTLICGNQVVRFVKN
jgi:hypothetical protein